MASVIPTLDLSLAENPATRPALLGDLRRAITEVGFLYIVNHGVPDVVVADVIRILPELFALTPENKNDVALHRSPHFLGYSAAGTEKTAGRADRREQFEFATELEASWVEGRPLYERLRGPNQWPSLPPVRLVVGTYISHLTQLAERFLDLVCEALEISSQARDKLFSFLSDQHRLKLIRYPPTPTPTQGDLDRSPHSQGVGPHKASSGGRFFCRHRLPMKLAEGCRSSMGAAPKRDGSRSLPSRARSSSILAKSLRSSLTGCAAGERFSAAFFQGVKGPLTRTEAIGALNGELAGLERKTVDSLWLGGKDEAWEESQLRTKVQSHRDVGRRFYKEVVEEYAGEK